MKKFKIISIIINVIILLNLVLPIISIAVEEIEQSNLEQENEIKEEINTENKEDDENNNKNDNLSNEDVAEETNYDKSDIEKTILTNQENTEDGKENIEEVEQTSLELSPEELFDTMTDSSLKVAYMSYIQDTGWQDPVTDNELSGTTGKNSKIEAMRIKLLNAPVGASIKYKVYVEGQGWKGIASDGEIIGTTGQNRKIYAVKIELENMEAYSIQYRVHLADYGWQDWKCDGGLAGTIADQKQIEAIEMRIISKVNKTIGVKYCSYIQSSGWQNEVQDGETAGITGQNRTLQAITISLDNSTLEGKITYQVHMQNIGWEDWIEEGKIAGNDKTSGQMEAIRIKLENIEGYNVTYRAHVSDIGWQNWVSNGEIAGTTGQNKKIEAIEIKITSKIEEVKEVGVVYNSHIQDYGWENDFSHKNGETSGTVGENKKVEAFKIKLNNNAANTGIQYSTYIEGQDWQDWMQNGKWSQNGEIAGTTGKNRKVFAIKISLQGLEQNSVAYRVHLQDIGWQDWKYDGEIAGDINCSKKIEAIQIKITPKQQSGELKVVYNSHVQDIGWQPSVENGQVSGTVGQNRKIEAIQIELQNSIEGSGIQYKTYIEKTGWQDWQKDNAISGTVGKNLKMYGIKIRLTGLDNYSVQYRVHIEDYGWTNWYIDGETAGNVAEEKKIEGIQIRIIQKTYSYSMAVEYCSYLDGIGFGWEKEYASNAEISGTVGQNRKMFGIKMRLKNVPDGAKIQYSTHIQDVGWTDYVESEQVSGQIDNKRKIEAIRIELLGMDNYTVEYRVHVQDLGWTEWRMDGEVAGTTGQNKKIEAIQVRLVPKKKHSGIDFSVLDETRYPGYKSALQEVQSRHPNWSIKILYTGLDWNEVVTEQDKFSGGSPKSLIQDSYSGEWINGTTKYDVTGRWYRASRKAIAYMMDPRNSLTEKWIFQFQDLSSSSGTRTEIAKMTQGTFLNKDTLIDAILETSRAENVSPFHIVSRIIQESGIEGNSEMNGYPIYGRTVYNLFNINVSGNTSAGLLAGARYAYNQGWFSQEASIRGGTKFIKEKYIAKGQSSLYFQKYNVVNKEALYEHQYMQNIRAANDEGNIMYNAFVKNGTLDSHFEFIIPIYENMPLTPEPTP